MALLYKEGALSFGDSDPCRLLALAKKNPGPFYVYHLGDILERVRALRKECPRLVVHYAMKANSHHGLLSALAKEGIGADVVSHGEVRLALAAGFTGDRIIFSGVAKTRAELEAALRADLKQINVESLEELSRLAEVARALGKTAPVAFRFNPDVDAKTHPYIATGLWDNKFGIDQSGIPELVRILHASGDALALRGISIHIGSQIADLGAIEDAIRKTSPLFEELKREGFPLRTFDIGGGLGVNYETEDTQPSQDFTRLKEYGAMVNRLLGNFDGDLFCEPGRILVGRSGVLVGRVEYVKHNAKKSFLICNTGVHHFPRPALYGAFHRILPLEHHPERKALTYDVVGPLCESSDVLGANRTLPEVRSGEYIAVADTGAYGMVMANRYNQHELPAEYLWHNGALLS